MDFCWYMMGPQRAIQGDVPPLSHRRDEHHIHVIHTEIGAVLPPSTLLGEDMEIETCAVPSEKLVSLLMPVEHELHHHGCMFLRHLWPFAEFFVGEISRFECRAGNAKRHFSFPIRDRKS